jgi:hypothetical protein
MNRRHFLQSSAAAGVATALPASSAFALFQALTQVTGDVRAVTGDRQEVSLEKAVVQELADGLRGNLLLPGNDGYDTARNVLNASIDKHPALIVQPSGVADVQTALRFANERKLLVAVKCGGHSYSGKSTCDDGMQIDLSTLRHCRVDPVARTANVAGGSLLAALDHEAMAHGLVTTAGTVSHTGVGGLTLGGGFGRLARRFGLALDNVIGVDVVTADGRLLHANADENPDLYWGVRGGGGNFGVVTAFSFRLHPMQRTVVGGEMLWPLEKSRDVLRFYADYALGAPDELYCDFYMTAPGSGENVGVGLHVCYSGAESDADKVLAPIRKLGEPDFNSVAAMDYVAIQQSWDNTDPRNTGEYLKSGFINEFPQSVADTLIDGFEPSPDRDTTVFFQHSGGAIGRVPVEATAFSHRKSQANMFAVVTWPLGEDRTPHVDYIRQYWKDVEAATDGYYTNEVADEPQAQVNKNYQGNFPRLLEVKKKYDPENLFRLNANIAPG